MSTAGPPVLYSFRRCPYAIRARLALRYAEINVALREVVLKDKPVEMLECSPKGTVPVLVLADEIIDESLDIMLWALAQHDPDGWLDADLALVNRLIEANDDQFKPWLDRYKYPDRYAELEPGEPRKHCALFLGQLEEQLGANSFLCGNRATLADMALYSFVRQCAFVDSDWFEQRFGRLSAWLQAFLEGPLFLAVMDKYPQWRTGDKEPVF